MTNSLATTVVYLNACGMVSSLGSTHDEVRQRVFERINPGVMMSERWSPGRPVPLGQVHAPLPGMTDWPVAYQSRNNRMALAALAQIRPDVDAALMRYGADRVGIVIGTSTSGVAETETAMRHYVAHGSLPDGFDYAQQELGSPASMLAQELGCSAPAYSHSSACTSSAKAMASAARLLRMKLCDAVVCGGVDTLCAFTLAGFSALESVSSQHCNPFSAYRRGINIGEGAALFLMTRESTVTRGDSVAITGVQSSPAAVALCGWGESSDGYHMSAPDPQGGGARLSIKQALLRAGVKAEQIDYINMHGTATVQNDAMEAHVIHDLFGSGVAVSSTKPLTGHALGAAAAIEAALCWLTMQNDNPDGKLPPHLWDGVQDTTLPKLNLVKPGMQLGRPVRWAMSNSFAFGGSNATLIFGKVT